MTPRSGSWYVFPPFDVFLGLVCLVAAVRFTIRGQFLAVAFLS